MTTVRLADIAAINPRGEAVDADTSVSFVGMAELDAEQAIARPLTSRRFSEVAKGYTVFRDGDVLAAKITPCWENGKVGQATLDHPVGVGSTEFHVLRPGPELSDRYLLHYLRQPSIRRQGELRMTGSAGQKRVPPGFLQELKIPLPLLSEQRRIAAILDHADALRAKRRQVLAHLDSLTQAIFHDMFGDPDSSTTKVAFGSVARLAAGRNLVADDAASPSPYRVLKISAVTTGQFRPTESKPLPAGYIPPPDHLVREGDLLMSRANTSELVGAVAYVPSTPPNLALPDKVWRFEWIGDAEPVFYQALLSAPAVRRRISRLASGTGGSMKNISKAKLETMPLPRVSLEQQRAFVVRATLINEYHDMIERAVAADDDLFASLQCRAFQQEL